MKIMVVAPEFPLINQPWMDTYLEQLLINKIDFRVFSLNRNPKSYGEKVDRLGLLEKTVSFDLSKRSAISSIFKVFPIFSSFRAFIRIHRSGVLGSLGGFKLFTYIMHFYSIMDESFGDIDLIHSHAESMSYRFIVLAELLNVPLVMTFHGLPPQGVPQLSQDKRKELYQYARTVIVNTKFAKAQVERFGCAAEKIVVLPQGLPLEDFPYRPKPVLKDGEVFHILSVGRFHRDKGQHYSLLALKRLLVSGVKAHWTFVGAGPNLSRLKLLTEKFGLEQNVSFRTDLSSKELVEQYQSANVFVLASIDTPGGHVETQGVVLQEAQASGCLVVATKTGGIPECLDSPESSLLIKQQSSKQIFCALSEFLDNRHKWDDIQRNARKKVESEFSASVIGRKMSRTLIDCVQRHSEP